MHCKKKVRDFPVPSRDVTYQTLPGKVIIKLFLARESLVSLVRVIQAGDGKIINLFFSAALIKGLAYRLGLSGYRQASLHDSLQYLFSTAHQLGLEKYIFCNGVGQVNLPVTCQAASFTQLDRQCSMSGSTYPGWVASVEDLT